MGYVNAGRDQTCKFIIGGGTITPGQANTYYDVNNAALGVGDSSTAVASGQTDLQAATNKLRKLVTGAPTAVGNVLTFVTTFGAAEANYVWAEIGLFNSPTAATGTMLSRLVTAMGTKASGSSWTVTYTLTIAAS
jgi:hypothetical protein